MKFIVIVFIFMVASVNAQAAGGALGAKSKNYTMILVRDLESSTESDDAPGYYITNMVKGTLEVKGLRRRRPTTELRFPTNDLKVYYKWTYKDNYHFDEFVGAVKTFDDGSAVIYDIYNPGLLPQVHLPKNEQRKLFKAQWATVKDGELYVGGNGHRLKLHDGSFNDDQMWVQIVNSKGTIRWADWSNTFAQLRSLYGVGDDTGYLVIGACQWSNQKRRFFMLPRGISTDNSYEDIPNNGYKGSNKLITLDEDGRPVQFFNISTHIATRSFTALQFVPGTKDTLIATLQVHEGKKLIPGDSLMSINNVEEGYYTVKNQKASSRFRYNNIIFIPFYDMKPVKWR